MMTLKQIKDVLYAVHDVTIYKRGANKESFRIILENFKEHGNLPSNLYRRNKRNGKGYMKRVVLEVVQAMKEVKYISSEVEEASGAEDFLMSIFEDSNIYYDALQFSEKVGV